MEYNCGNNFQESASNERASFETQVWESTGPGDKQFAARASLSVRRVSCECTLYSLHDDTTLSLYI